MAWTSGRRCIGRPTGIVVGADILIVQSDDSVTVSATDVHRVFMRLVLSAYICCCCSLYVALAIPPDTLADLSGIGKSGDREGSQDEHDYVVVWLTRRQCWPRSSHLLQLLLLWLLPLPPPPPLVLLKPVTLSALFILMLLLLESSMASGRSMR